MIIDLDDKINLTGSEKINFNIQLFYTIVEVAAGTRKMLFRYSLSMRESI